MSRRKYKERQKRLKSVSSHDLPKHEPPTGGEFKLEGDHSNPQLGRTSELPASPAAYRVETEKDWWNKKKRWVEIAGIVLLAVYTGYTVKMYYANKQAADAATTAARAAEGANNLAQLSNRAWIGPSKPTLQLSRPPRPGEQVPLVNDLLVARMVFANTGRTPALNVRIYTTGFIAPLDFGPHGEQYFRFEFPHIKDKDYELVGNIPPDGNVGKDINIDTIRLTKDKVAQLNKPTHRAVIIGKGLYCDVANPNVTHWFTFSLFLVLPGDPRFGVYPQYNDIGDEDKPCHAG